MDAKTHILVIPFPIQGHINPMLHFSKRLASKGTRATLVTTTTISKSMQARPNLVEIESVNDGFNEIEKPESVDAFIENFRVVISESLAAIINKHRTSGYPVKVLVYDSMAPWALDLAHQLGLRAAVFFTQSCSVDAIYYHMQQGTLKIPNPKEEGSSSMLVSIPSLPLLAVNDLPDMHLYPLLLSVNISQLSNFQKADWLLFNTFDKLEEKVVKWMASQWPIKTIGPTIPSMYLDKRLQDDKDYGLSLFKPNAEACIKWLDAKKIGSVVYVSFGSLATLDEHQMEEVASGLLKSDCYFLWVVRASEERKLPSNFIGQMSEKVLVVNWCPQLEVLAHKSVGCFMTHCGWNSTLEALSLGVPFVAMPQWTDQTTNAKFIVELWQVGIRAKVDEKGIVTREEIEDCVKQVMEGETSKELKRNAVKWKEMAKEAMDEGGSSDKNIDEFVSQLGYT